MGFALERSQCRLRFYQTDLKSTSRWLLMLSWGVIVWFSKSKYILQRTLCLAHWPPNDPSTGVSGFDLEPLLWGVVPPPISSIFQTRADIAIFSMEFNYITRR